jgi:hypothetical protein
MIPGGRLARAAAVFVARILHERIRGRNRSRDTADPAARRAARHERCRLAPAVGASRKAMDRSRITPYTSGKILTCRR